MDFRYMRRVLLPGLLVLLAGCGGAISSSSPTAVPSPTLTPSPTPLGPVQPAAPGIYLGTGDGSLVALNLSDGTQRWKQGNGSEFHAPMVLDHHVLYVGLGQAVAALNASDGVQRWKTTLVDPNSPNGAEVDRLLVANGVVYVGTEQFLNALNASDGTLLWRSAQPVGPVINLAISADTLYLNNGILYAFNASDGTERWEWYSEISGPVGTHLSTMALVNDTLYTADTGRLDGTAYVFAVDVKTGKERWRAHLGKASSSYWEAGVLGLAVEGGKVFVTADVAPAEALYALDSSTGKPLWHFSLPAGARFPTAPTAAGDMAYVAATDTEQQSGLVYALHASDGSLRWHFSTAGPAAQGQVALPPHFAGPERPLSSGPLVFTPVVLNGVLYVRAQSGVSALAADTGLKQWMAEPGGANAAEWVIG
jgi:outer membrane protein assembly factor BamB